MNSLRHRRLKINLFWLASAIATHIYLRRLEIYLVHVFIDGGRFWLLIYTTRSKLCIACSFVSVSTTNHLNFHSYETNVNNVDYIVVKGLLHGLEMEATLTENEYSSQSIADIGLNVNTWKE